MALTPYEPDGDDAQGLARVFETVWEELFDVHNAVYATARFIYKPMCDEILALIALVYGQFVTVDKAADYTILAADNLKTYTNKTAVAQVILTLPAATAGKQNNFYVNAAFNLRLLSVGTDTIQMGAQASIAAGYVECDEVGSYLQLRCLEDGKWIASSIIGSWDVQIS